MPTFGNSSSSSLMRLALVLTGFALAVLAAYAPAAPPPTPSTPARADSSEWENLLVLPDTLTRDELIGIMRGFNDALGVQCGYCHVREGEDLRPALDEKAPKEIARGMIRMTWQINREILPAIEALDSAEVTCYTCHRGTAHVPAGAEEGEHDESHGDHSHGPR